MSHHESAKPTEVPFCNVSITRHGHIRFDTSPFFLRPSTPYVVAQCPTPHPPVQIAYQHDAYMTANCTATAARQPLNSPYGTRPSRWQPANCGFGDAATEAFVRTDGTTRLCGARLCATLLTIGCGRQPPPAMTRATERATVISTTTDSPSAQRRVGFPVAYAPVPPQPRATQRQRQLATARRAGQIKSSRQIMRKHSQRPADYGILRATRRKGLRRRRARDSYSRIGISSRSGLADSR